MVYRLAKPEKKSRTWFWRYVMLRQGILLLLIFAILYLLYPLDWYQYVVGFLVALALVGWQARVLLLRHERRFDALGTLFVTLVDAGVLVESEDSGARFFVPWTRLSRAWLRQDMLMLQQTNGLFHLLPTGSLKREQAEEMLAYVNDQIGKSDASPLNPPAALLVDSPVRMTASPAQWREFAGCIQQDAVPGGVALKYIGLAIFSCAFVLCYENGLLDFLFAISCVIAAFILLLLDPGIFARTLRKNPSPGYLHVSPEAVLVQSDSGAWAVLPTELFTSARQLRHGIIYRTRIFSSVLADRTSASSPYLPQLRKSRRWLHWVAIPSVLIVLPVLVNMSCAFFSDESVVPSEFSKAMDRGDELTRYVEEVMPPMPYPGPIVWCCLMVDPDRTIVSCVWESEIEIDVELYENEAGQPEDCPADEE